jgi:glycosyltransferase involved in cell wall biosynthesis
VTQDVVAVVQHFVPHYRVALFDALSDNLAAQGLRLEVWHGDAPANMAEQRNAADGSWSVWTPQRQFSLAGTTFTYRRIQRRARRVRAVVHGLASTSLETYALAADPRVNLMLWGHGRNFTVAERRMDDVLEGWLCRRAAHLFVYTDAGADHLVSRGHSRGKITVVRNSTDTSTLVEHQRLTGPVEARELRADLGLQGKRVGLFVGAYDEFKKLPFLFEAADRIHEQRDDFVLGLAGDGPMADQVRAFAAERDYVRVLGRVDEAALGRLSTVVDLVLMPGRVGLVAVDSLALGLPLVTTNDPYHAPEADYLTEETSLWLPAEVDSYAAGVVALLDDLPRRERMSAAARAIGATLSTDDAGARFAEGILAGLGS